MMYNMNLNSLKMLFCRFTLAVKLLAASIKFIETGYYLACCNVFEVFSNGIWDLIYTIGSRNIMQYEITTYLLIYIYTYLFYSMISRIVTVL